MKHLKCAILATLTLLALPLKVAANNLVIALHEVNDAAESPHTATPGGTTVHAAAALEQQVAPVVMSGCVLHNIVHRRQEFEKKSNGTDEYKLRTAFTEMKAGKGQAFSTVCALLKTNPESVYNLFLWSLPLTDSRFAAYYHNDSATYVLIPRTQLSSSGINIDLMEPVTLPALTDTTGTARLVSDAYAHSNRFYFTAARFAPLLSTSASWNVYQNGHGTVPGRDEDSDALLHDRWFSWPSLPRHDVRKTSIQNQLEKGRTIGGLPLSMFREMLLLFNKLNTGVFYYQSCFGSGQNSAIIHRYNSSDGLTFAPSLGLRFPLIVGALTDSVTYRSTPLLMSSGSWQHPYNLRAFFSQASSSPRTVGQLHALAVPITNTDATPDDPHGISATPMALLPGAKAFIPLDVHRGSSDNLEAPSSGRPGLLTITAVRAKSSSPLNIHNTRAVLVIPSTVAAPLIISPYRHHSSAVTKYLPQLPPALISLPPDDAIHRLHKVELKGIGLRAFMVHSFMHLKKQKNAKAFLIDALTVDNDLTTEFALTSGSGSYVDLLTGWFSATEKPAASVATGSRITLKNVLIYTASNRLQIYFLHPAGDGSVVAKHANYRTGDAPNLLKPGKSKVFVALHEMKNSLHERLFTHYLHQHQQVR